MQPLPAFVCSRRCFLFVHTDTHPFGLCWQMHSAQVWHPSKHNILFSQQLTILRMKTGTYFEKILPKAQKVASLECHGMSVNDGLSNESNDSVNRRSVLCHNRTLSASKLGKSTLKSSSLVCTKTQRLCSSGRKASNSEVFELPLANANANICKEL